MTIAIWWFGHSFIHSLFINSKVICRRFPYLRYSHCATFDGLPLKDTHFMFLKLNPGVVVFQTSHLCLTAEGASKFARAMGVPEVSGESLVTDYARMRWKRNLGPDTNPVECQISWALESCLGMGGSYILYWLLIPFSRLSLSIPLTILFYYLVERWDDRTFLTELVLLLLLNGESVTFWFLNRMTFA